MVRKQQSLLLASRGGYLVICGLDGVLFLFRFMMVKVVLSDVDG